MEADDAPPDVKLARLGVSVTSAVLLEVHDNDTVSPDAGDTGSVNMSDAGGRESERIITASEVKAAPR
jgi:hypothetical protein